MLQEIKVPFLGCNEFALSVGCNDFALGVVMIILFESYCKVPLLGGKLAQSTAFGATV